MGDFYVYLHLKADTGEVFYVGKGKGRRVYQGGRRRSDYWNRVAAKHGVTIQILAEGLTEEEAFAKERNTISELRSNGASLVNITDGGEGSSRRGQTDEKKTRIIAFVKKHGRFPSQRRESEKTLRGWFGSYCYSSGGCFDPAFREEMYALGYGSIAGLHHVSERVKQNVQEKKQAILDFHSRNGRFPSQSLKGELQMHKWLANYCSPASESHDPAFREEVLKLGYGQGKINSAPTGAKKDAIKTFYAEKGRFPSRFRHDEKQLSSALRSYCSPACNSYDEIFDKEMRALGYGQNKGKRIKEKP